MAIDYHPDTHQAANGHTDHEEAGVTGERASASSSPRRTRRATTAPAALADPVVRAYLAALAQGECERLTPVRDTGGALDRVNAALVIDKLTAAVTELRAGSA